MDRKLLSEFICPSTCSRSKVPLWWPQDDQLLYHDTVSVFVFLVEYGASGLGGGWGCIISNFSFSLRITLELSLKTHHAYQNAGRWRLSVMTKCMWQASSTCNLRGIFQCICDMSVNTEMVLWMIWTLFNNSPIIWDIIISLSDQHLLRDKNHKLHEMQS